MEERQRGRLVCVKLVALECGTKIKLIGAYAPGRSGERRAAETWEGAAAATQQAIRTAEAKQVGMFWDALWRRRRRKRWTPW